jgi:sulfonate transport system substrate-binding protein
MKRIFTLALVLILAFSMFTGCGNTPATEQKTPDQSSGTQNSEEPTKPAEKIDIKISHHPYLHALPSVYAEENGLYENFNYTIEMFPNGPVQNEAIASGAWEVGTTGIAGAVLGIVGYNMKIIGIIYDDAPIDRVYVRPDSELAQAQPDAKGVRGTADQWRGKKILCARGTNAHLTLIAILNHLGLTENDVNIIDTSVPNSYTAFMADEGDIVVLWAPYIYDAETEGWVEVAKASNLGVSMPSLIVATEEAVNNRPEAVQAWLEAYLKGVDGLLQDVDKSAQMLYDFEVSEGISITEEGAELEFENKPLFNLQANKEYYKPDANGRTRAHEIVEYFADFMVSQGTITPEQKKAILENNCIISDFVINIK